MGHKRPSTRTLKESGEKVVHHPDGSQVMIPSDSLVAGIVATEGAARRSAQSLDRKRLKAVDHKVASLDSGEPVPDDQRVV